MEVSSRKNIQLKKAFSPSQATLEHMNDGLYKGPNRHTIGRSLIGSITPTLGWMPSLSVSKTDGF